MNDALKMQISAFVDGELPDSEAELLTRRFGRDAELRQQVERYLEIGRLMRGERTVRGAGGISARVSAALENEAPLAATAGGPPGSAWMKPAAGVAIAASVAVLALMGLRQLDGSETGQPVPTAAIAVDDGGSYTEPTASEVVPERPGDRLLQFYRSHGQTAGELGTNGILSELVTLEQLIEVAPGGSRPLESGGDEDDNKNRDSEQE